MNVYKFAKKADYERPKDVRMQFQSRVRRLMAMTKFMGNYKKPVDEFKIQQQIDNIGKRVSKKRSQLLKIAINQK